MPEDEFELALHCADEPIRTWLLLAGYLGLRAMEVAAIRREDVTEAGGRLVLSGMGKGRKPFRLPVPREVAPYLLPHLVRLGPLWRNSTGRQVTAYGVSRDVSRFMHSIGLPYGLHSLRHRFGTRFYAATRDALLTQEVMRHSSLNTTRLYVQMQQDEAAAALDELSTTLRPKTARKPRKAA